MQVRAATEADVEAICRICAEGWRDTYAGLRAGEEIEQVIASFYTPDRVKGELSPSGPEWGGWLVAEDGLGEVVAAGAGGMTAPGIGEIYVLYADPSRRREGAGSALLLAMTAQQLAHRAREQWVSVEEECQRHPVLRAPRFRRCGQARRHEMSGSSLRYVRKLPEDHD